jgi:hypothetical protein
MTDEQTAKKEEKPKLAKVVAFRLVEADHTAYLKKVEASCLSPSEFFRDCVLTNKTQIIARPKASYDKKQLLFLYNKASNNLNQLAHRANAEHRAGLVNETTYNRILSALESIARNMQKGVSHAD